MLRDHQLFPGVFLSQAFTGPCPHRIQMLQVKSAEVVIAAEKLSSSVLTNCSGL